MDVLDWLLSKLSLVGSIYGIMRMVFESYTLLHGNPLMIHHSLYVDLRQLNPIDQAELAEILHTKPNYNTICAIQEGGKLKVTQYEPPQLRVIYDPAVSQPDPQSCRSGQTFLIRIEEFKRLTSA